MSSVEYLLWNIQFDFKYIGERVKLKIFSNRIYFHFMCMCVLPTCTDLYHMTAWCLWKPEEGGYPLKRATMWVLETTGAASTSNH